MLLAAYSGWWWLTARNFETTVNRWIAAEQAKGASITPATVSIGGFPTAFAVSLAGADFRWPSGFGFTGQSVDVRARPWSLFTFNVTAVGGLAFTVPPGTIRPAFKVAGETLRGSTTFNQGSVPTAMTLRADAVSTALIGQTGQEVSVTGVEFTESRPATPPAADTDVAADLSLKLLELSAPVLDGNPLGNTIKQMALHVTLMGVPPRTLDNAGLKAWRESGGNINVPDLSMSWGQLDIGLNGTLALDEAMQPEGAFTAQMTGYDQAIDALAAAGWIKPSGASIAKLGLGLTARPGADGKPFVKTPLTIQNRVISAGAIRLGQLPELKLD